MKMRTPSKKLISLLLSCAALMPALAQKGADQINVNGEFVLAAKAGRTERAAALLTQGAAVNSRDRNGDSPLNMAASNGNEALVDVLLKAGADVNLANISGVTPLMGAAFKGNAAIVRKLMAAGAKTDPLDRVKKNAPIYAAGVGCNECLAEFLRAGSQVNARMDNDETLLMWAAGYGHAATVQFLLEQGADRHLKDNRGKTAADMARDGNFTAALSLLDNS
ncbi:MAG: ankyrin repeat domain-containing protein [Polaromonas sp.]